ncbi:MAG: aldo/keto reductase [Paludibacteraceae bacterium]|nr:aldo/keto reductase [Paludibacteraceae bacterium]
MEYRFSGKSGLQLPLVSLGLWHNFGSEDPFDVARAMLLHAWDKGVTHFDIANNYGPAPGTAEMTFGRVLREDLLAHRDEMIVSSKAGYWGWDGPYGNGGSRKYMIASCDQSLKRTGLEYFDIFYSHRYDPQTPIEETMQTLVDIVRAGKALYAGISNYPADKQKECYDYLSAAHVPCVISQYKASIAFPQTLEENLPVANANGSGFICYSPLAQGLLTNRYLNGIPAGSRASKNVFLHPEQVTAEAVARAQQLGAIAAERGQTLAQMAVAWLLSKDVTSVIIGASSVAQLDDNLQAINNIAFTADELQQIERIMHNQ